MTRRGRAHQFVLDDWLCQPEGFVVRPQLVRFGHLKHHPEDDRLLEDVRQRGFVVPLLVEAETGYLVDGHHRLGVARRLGIRPPFVVVPRKDLGLGSRWHRIAEAGCRGVWES